MRNTQSSRLESLPSELFLTIAEHADFEARLSLSATNSLCRTLLLQTIFRTLRITSDEVEANQVLALAKEIGDNVRAISFHGTAGPNPTPDEQDHDQNTTDSQQWALPPAAAALLGGEHLPNATTLIVHFSFDFDSGDGTWDSRDDLSDGMSMYAFTVEETSKAMIDESEAEFPWRRLMAQTWASACANRNTTELIVKDLIPKAVSPWFSPQWERFLGQILVADIQIWGGDNSVGWEVGTLEGYMYFIARLDTYFFNFMKNTETLRLTCYEHGPLGSTWTGVKDTMSLRPECFPRLQHLRIKYLVICAELAAFLQSKRDMLKHITLHECFASDEPGPFTWADFFAALRKSKPKWQSFSVTNDYAPPLTFKEWHKSRFGQKDEEEGEEPESVKSVRAELVRDPKKRLFLYATLTDKYGDRWPVEDSIMEHFEAGRDLDEFEKLMCLIGETGEF